MKWVFGLGKEQKVLILMLPPLTLWVMKGAMILPMVGKLKIRSWKLSPTRYTQLISDSGNVDNWAMLRNKALKEKVQETKVNSQHMVAQHVDLNSCVNLYTKRNEKKRVWLMKIMSSHCYFLYFLFLFWYWVVLLHCIANVTLG